MIASRTLIRTVSQPPNYLPAIHPVLSRWCSHPESNWGPLPYQGSALPPELCEPHGAGSGNRTRVSSLEGWGSTAELYPPDLFRLSNCALIAHKYNGGGGWIRTTEACASDLQSDPFGHSGTPPTRTRKGRFPWLFHSGAAFYGN
jgi:hypothetical protein